MLIALNNIRSAWNVGAIMRSCNGIGCDILLIGYTPKPTGNTAKMLHKSGRGYETSVNWKYFESYQEALELYKDHTHLGVEIDTNSVDIYSYLQQHLISDKTVLWFGNEHAGLEPNLMSQFDAIVHLPMNGTAVSLNVASTACTVGYLTYYRIHNP
jgi:tRNA G18 (ribose-2'-O)-methylase SpoU